MYLGRVLASLGNLRANIVKILVLIDSGNGGVPSKMLNSLSYFCN